jgi:excisionase family DNA binding protein
VSRRRNSLPFHAREPRRLLTTSEVAEYERVTPLTVRRWIQQGKLPAVRVGRDYRIIGRDLVQGLRTFDPQTGRWRPLDPDHHVYKDLLTIGPEPTPRRREFSTKEAAALLCVSTRFLRNEIQAKS